MNTKHFRQPTFIEQTNGGHFSLDNQPVNLILKASSLLGAKDGKSHPGPSVEQKILIMYRVYLSEQT